jgi:hypothetical protein
MSKRHQAQWKKRKASYVKQIAEANKVNASRGVKQFYFSDDLLNLIVDADFAPVMPVDMMGRSFVQGEARRSFCIEIDAMPVEVENATRKATTDRPENAVRANLLSFMKLIGKNEYYAIRGESYREGEIPPVWVVRV